jgi:hypothetical protein
MEMLALFLWKLSVVSQLKPWRTDRRKDIALTVDRKRPGGS